MPYHKPLRILCKLSNKNQHTHTQLVILIFCAVCSELKDNYATAEFRAERLEGMPELLKAMINANPNIFNGPSGRLLF